GLRLVGRRDGDLPPRGAVPPFAAAGVRQHRAARRRPRPRRRDRRLPPRPPPAAARRPPPRGAAGAPVRPRPLPGARRRRLADPGRRRAPAGPRRLAPGPRRPGPRPRRMKLAIQQLTAGGPPSAAQIEKFLADHTFPIVEGNSVTFVFRGDADAVYLQHWIFGLPKAVPFRSVEGSDLWFLVQD